MRDFNVLYDWVIDRIDYLSRSGAAELYAQGANTSRNDSFVDLTEAMLVLRGELDAARTARTHSNAWSRLYDVAQQFQLQFADFPDARIKQFRLFILIASKVSQAGFALDASDINETAFEIRELTTPLPPSWFSRENIQSILESVAAFSCANLDSLEVELVSVNVSPTFGLHFLATLRTLNADMGDYHVLVKKMMPQTALPAVDGFVRLSMLATGRTIHKSKIYTNPPMVLEPDKIRIGAPYQQWNDIFDVISDYNDRRDLLLKYLTIYHVIENFMFKRPIVELETKQSGKMFTIRDFRRLYKQVETAEIDALKQLMRVILSMQATPSLTFQQHLTSRWTTGMAPLVPADIDRAFSTLGLSYTFANFAASDFHASLAHFIYQIRNAIVHNKETEFHITYGTLDNVFSSLIEIFLIPTLEEISFAMVGARNSSLWYSQDKLLFYQ